MNRKLKAWQVVRVRELAARGETQERLAEMYHVGLMTINDVVLRKTWMDVEDGFDDEEPHLQTVKDPSARCRGWGGSVKDLHRLISKWIASRSSVDLQRSSALAFNYSPSVLDFKSVPEGKKRRTVVFERPDGFTKGPILKEPLFDDAPQVRLIRLKNRNRPLPSNALCWALTFEIVLRDTLYTSERWAIARWHKDERNVMPFPQRAAEKLIRECRRRGLIY